jgi:hypothetical protein
MNKIKQFIKRYKINIKGLKQFSLFFILLLLNNVIVYHNFSKDLYNIETVYDYCIDTLKVNVPIFDTIYIKKPIYYDIPIKVYDTIYHHIDVNTDTEYNIIDSNIYDNNLYFILGD